MRVYVNGGGGEWAFSYACLAMRCFVRERSVVGRLKWKDSFSTMPVFEVGGARQFKKVNKIW